MNEEIIKQKITDAIHCHEINLTGDGYHYHVEIISTAFENLSRVKRQQLIYAIFSDEIKSGELHALSIKASTPDEKQ